MFLVNRKIQSCCAIHSREIQISSSSFQNLQCLAVNSKKIHQDLEIEKPRPKQQKHCTNCTNCTNMLDKYF